MFKKSYDTIIKGFTKTITQLEELVEQNENDASENQNTIHTLEAKNRNLLSERNKALNTAQKLKALLED